MVMVMMLMMMMNYALPASPAVIEWASAQVPPTLPLGHPIGYGLVYLPFGKLRLGGCLTVPSKPTKKTRQGLAAKALQQAQEQLRHGQGAASQGALR